MVSAAEMGVQTMNKQSENKKADTELTEEQLGTVAGGTKPPPGLAKPTLTPAKKIVLDLDGKPMGYPPNTFDGGPSSE
jgi:hypothetical protein